MSLTPKLVIVLGETTAKPQQLTENGAAFDGTGLTVELEIEKYVNGAFEAVGTPPTVDWLAIAEGTVEITGVEGLTVGNYYVRYKVTNGAGEFDYFPNSKGADHWAVVPVANVA